MVINAGNNARGVRLVIVEVVLVDEMRWMGDGDNF